MSTVKDIFGRIQGREWDWFGFVKNPQNEVKNNERIHWFNDDTVTEFLEVPQKLYITREGFKDTPLLTQQFTIADLLANKSWCKAVWGCGHPNYPSIQNDVKFWDNPPAIWAQCLLKNQALPWQKKSTKTFQILQQQGQQAAIDYITDTML